MGYLIAAAFGATLAVAIPWWLHRAAARAWAPRTGDSFHQYFGLIVPDARGTTEVDEILVTPAGVFVIEKKHYNAWIFGEEGDEFWTAAYRNREKHQFQNPLRQNYRHVKALESFLGVSRSVFTSLVVFSGRARLIKAPPPGVLMSDHLAVVHSRQDVVISPEEFDHICSALDVLQSQSDGASLDRHTQDLRSRFESTTRCPKCGGNLVPRQSRTQSSNRFLGCSNYPACRYLRDFDAT